MHECYSVRTVDHVQYGMASDDKGRQSARSKAAEAQDREAQALDMVRQINSAPMPQV